MSKVLIIDDDQKILFAFKHKLSNIGFEVVTAKNAHNGLERLRNERDIDLVLLDYMMPDMDGLTAFYQIKGQSSNPPPVIMLTYHTDYRIATQFLQAQGTDFLDKNIDPYQLKNKIDSHIAHARSTAEATRRRLEAEAALHQANELLVEKTKILAEKNAVLEQQAILLKKQADDLATANRELQQFADIVAHDLREPLRNISNSLQFIKWDFENDINPKALEYLDFAMQGAIRLSQMIKGLTTFANVNSILPFEEVDTMLVIKETLENLRLSVEDNDTVISIIGEMPTLIAHKYQLLQVFQNLIANSIKFRKITASPHITIAYQEQETHHVFSVKDNGIGFEPVYAKRIFGIFQRLHSPQAYSGSGIGLSICEKIVHRHNGTIEVQSTPNVGTTFTFSIAKNLKNSRKSKR